MQQTALDVRTDKLVSAMVRKFWCRDEARIYLVDKYVGKHTDWKHALAWQDVSIDKLVGLGYKAKETVFIEKSMTYQTFYVYDPTAWMNER